MLSLLRYIGYNIDVLSIPSNVVIDGNSIAFTLEARSASFPLNPFNLIDAFFIINENECHRDEPLTRCNPFRYYNSFLGSLFVLSPNSTAKYRVRKIDFYTELFNGSPNLTVTCSNTTFKCGVTESDRFDMLDLFIETDNLLGKDPDGSGRLDDSIFFDISFETDGYGEILVEGAFVGDECDCVDRVTTLGTYLPTCISGSCQNSFYPFLSADVNCDPDPPDEEPDEPTYQLPPGGYCIAVYRTFEFSLFGRSRNSTRNDGGVWTVDVDITGYVVRPPGLSGGIFVDETQVSTTINEIYAAALPAEIDTELIERDDQPDPTKNSGSSIRSNKFAFKSNGSLVSILEESSTVMTNGNFADLPEIFSGGVFQKAVQNGYFHASQFEGDFDLVETFLGSEISNTLTNDQLNFVVSRAVGTPSAYTCEEELYTARRRLPSTPSSLVPYANPSVCENCVNVTVTLSAELSKTFRISFAGFSTDVTIGSNPSVTVFTKSFCSPIPVNNPFAEKAFNWASESATTVVDLGLDVILIRMFGPIGAKIADIANLDISISTC